MRIGDKVRLLHGKEEGRIVQIKENKIVEIEIEDGFIIPALINEVVVVSPIESENFKKETTESTQEIPKQRADLLSNGIYLGLIENEINLFETFLVNQTTDTLLYSIGQLDKKSISGKSYGVCKSYDIKDLCEFTSSILNESKKISIQIIFHVNHAITKKQPLNIEFHITKAHLNKKKYLSTLDKEAYLIKLELDDLVDINPTKLQEKMMGGAAPIKKIQATRIKNSEQTIDLHVDKLTSELKSNEILDFQLNEFEKAFDNALLFDSEKLKVIHGIGEGTLRSLIHKRLSIKKEVKYFEDADKERFGFGSTIIYF